MAAAAFIVSLVALLAAGASVLYTRTQAMAAKRADHRARHPRLGLSLDVLASSGVDKVLYYIENQGQEDLDSVVVFRPVTTDGVRYPVAKLGGEYVDSADLGPLEIKARQGWVLGIGAAENLPQFRVRIHCRIGKDTWEDAYVLEDPRFHVNVF